MKGTSMRSSLWLTAAALVALIPQTASAERVGTAAAVNPDVTGTPPGGTARTLYVGADISFEERVVTSAIGKTQILFVDQSSLIVGPGAELIIDRFVYDPDRSSGELAISITKGVFRFVGGKISASNGATIRTPTATLGIRGSVVMGSADPMDVVFLSGSEMTVTGATGSLTLDARSIGRRIVTDANGVPKDAGRAGAETLRGHMAGLQSEGSGGATEPPTSQRTRRALPGPAGFDLTHLSADELVRLNTGRARASALERVAGGLGPDGRPGRLVEPEPGPGPGPGPGPDIALFDLPSPPDRDPGPRTDGTIQGYGTSLSFEYDGSDPIRYLTETTTLEGNIVAAGGAEPPSLTIERSVEGDQILADLFQYGFGGSSSSNSVFFDDRTFAAILPPSEGDPAGQRTMLATHDLVPARPGIEESKLCSCEFLTWGYWAADTPGYQGDGFEAPRELVALGTWVAGALPDANDIPNSGSASYSGHMVGSVVDNGRFRMATGSMTGDFDFGSRTGNMRVEDFDNRTYSGTTSGFSNRVIVGLTSTDGQISGNMVGSFARNGADPVGGIIGDVILSGNSGTYQAAGTIAGQKVPNAAAAAH